MYMLGQAIMGPKHCPQKATGNAGDPSIFLNRISCCITIVCLSITVAVQCSYTNMCSFYFSTSDK